MIQIQILRQKCAGMLFLHLCLVVLRLRHGIVAYTIPTTQTGLGKAITSVCKPLFYGRYQFPMRHKVIDGVIGSEYKIENTRESLISAKNCH